MKKELKILSLQFEAEENNKDKNLKTVSKMLNDNMDFEPDIVVLPEVWNTGANYKNFINQSEIIPDQTTMLLSGLAENYGVNIIAGSIIEKTFDGKFYNTSLVFDRNGAIIESYRKIHLFSHCGSNESAVLNNGENPCVFELEGAIFGLGICYDIRFPELFRKMMKSGAEIFVIPAAFPNERIKQWNILNQARALENLAALVSCNQYGSSNYISPYGEVINTSNSGECAIKNIVSISQIREAREKTPFLKDIVL